MEVENFCHVVGVRIRNWLLCCGVAVVEKLLLWVWLWDAKVR